MPSTLKEENKEEAEAGTPSYACTESVVSDSALAGTFPREQKVLLSTQKLVHECS